MIGLVCGGLEEESALNVLTFSELREIVSEGGRVVIDDRWSSEQLRQHGLSCPVRDPTD